MEGALCNGPAGGKVWGCSAVAGGSPCLGAVPPNTLPAQPGAVLVLPAQVMLLPGGAALKGLRWSLAADLGIG